MDEILIGDIIFTPKKRMINKGGSMVKIRNKESELLFLLCHHYPSSLSREDLEKAVWEGSYVTDNTLTQTISNLRNALDDKKHELVTTIPKKGYCIGVKPDFISNNLLQELLVTEGDLIDDIKFKIISSCLGFVKSPHKVAILVISFICFFTSFQITSSRYQIKIIDIKNSPILIGLDDVRDKDFLSSYLLIRKNPMFF
ncbi:reguatory protein [Yersinia pekkanenii]|uniref:Reguatory protein n=1 Tax=Yersinia pekkanenii TaxID=1288385 RepID=A0A0T9P8W0_9GAMM|nr:reguatory protein [Yersinia pekkanenii]CRY67838.1 reguatory protein [Yersinia pekkanenii]